MMTPTSHSLYTSSTAMDQEQTPVQGLGQEEQISRRSWVLDPRKGCEPQSSDQHYCTGSRVLSEKQLPLGQINEPELLLHSSLLEDSKTHEKQRN